MRAQYGLPTFTNMCFSTIDIKGGISLLICPSSLNENSISIKRKCLNASFKRIAYAIRYFFRTNGTKYDDADQKKEGDGLCHSPSFLFMRFVIVALFHQPVRYKSLYLTLLSHGLIQDQKALNHLR